ncbi:MAG TPA: ATP-binding protein [Streptosporangiaceae bacterium]|nr:ATP-binding protein [Streptosporangiaceae bacterium]
MLLRFEAANYRSILEPVELSMIAVDQDRAATRGFELLTERVLTVAGIYGPNASGKSNVIEALVWLSTAVGRSLRTWDLFVPREPFKFGPGLGTPSIHEVEMVVRDVRYAYRVEVDDAEVLFEGLYSYPERRRRVLFEREGPELHLRRGLGALAGTRELLTPTTLALSAAMRFDDSEVAPFGRQLSRIQVLGARRRAPWRKQPASLSEAGGLSLTERLFDRPGSWLQPALFDDEELVDPYGRESALALLRFADLGIDDVQVIDEGEDTARVSPSRRRLQLIHRAGEQQVPFDLTEESAGTQTWFALIGPALSALRHGQVLLFDEIDASLHPRLSARLLELFQDPKTNPRNAQLIFTTHDTSLLNCLNRDEVWLTEKAGDGATSLTALAEYGGDKVRRSLNLERAYLQGRFGAVPELDQQALRRALGLEPSDAG